MFKIPEDILNRLKCHLCDGYLNCKPVMLKDDQQICGKCFKILPLHEKQSCQRQIAFEAIGNCLIFPCRYHQMGCQYTYNFDNENAHEIQCKNRYFTVPDVVTEPSISSTNNNNDPEYENIYSTIGPQWHCFNCNTIIPKSSKNSCLYGHISCDNCKSDMCMACVKNLDGNSKIACKNASKGCKEILYQNDVGAHRDKCPFNDIACPIEKCEKKFMFDALMDHLKQEHVNQVILSNEVTKSVAQKNLHLVFVCYEGVFRMLYYYYVTYVEVVVEYLGPCFKAQEFEFEASVKVNNEVIKKRFSCANWNDYLLASGASFDRKELKIPDEKAIKFQLNLKIFKV
ncbi:hypothetical protein ABEB36_012558 [Hypothenemus hampei]|uniref:SIAH-type domain-containing protein n=1 Tax=Hypothenemus hampei TaxID=57062 RepID=A0ABD1EBS1_HYPHA